VAHAWDVAFRVEAYTLHSWVAGVAFGPRNVEVDREGTLEFDTLEEASFPVRRASDEGLDVWVDDTSQSASEGAGWFFSFSPSQQEHLERFSMCNPCLLGLPSRKRCVGKDYVEHYFAIHLSGVGLQTKDVFCR
jgi:hypothetical protein